MQQKEVVVSKRKMKQYVIKLISKAQNSKRKKLEYFKGDILAL